MTTPFHRPDGSIYFPWKPTGDRAFIFPSPPPVTFVPGGAVLILEKFRQEYAEGYGILLAAGPGFTNLKGKWKGSLPDLVPGCSIFYDVNVPWRALVVGQDGEKHIVVMCGTSDILGVEHGEHCQASV